MYVENLPGETGEVLLLRAVAGPAAAVAAAVAGLLGLAIVAPWITIGVARVNVALAQSLLGPSDRRRARRAGHRLETSRTAAVDSAESERRRIERDLHDGAQQRLVALGRQLGAAKEKIDVDPEEGRRMLADAHEEVEGGARRRSATWCAASTR